MTDKEKLTKVRAEIKRLYNQSLADENRQAELGLKSAACTSYGKSKVCKELLSFIDSMQEEPKECMYSKDNYTDEDRKSLCDGCEEKCKHDKSDDFTKALAECIHNAQCNVVDPMVHAEIWKEELLELAKGKEPVSEDLEQAVNAYIGYAPEVDESSSTYGKRQAFKAGANWQKQKDKSKVLTEEQCRKIRDDAFELGKDAMKQQMMAKAVDVTIAIPYQNGYGGYTQLVDSKEGLPFGENLKVLVIKE